MSFDAWIVGFGISTVIRELGLVEGYAAYSVLAAVAVIDSVLLYRFFSVYSRRLADQRAFEQGDPRFGDKRPTAAESDG